MPSPHTPNPMLHRAETKYEVGKVTDEEQAKQRRLRSILNKLTPQNFEKLFDQIKQVNIDNADTLSGVVGQIFDKALMEPTFVGMYAHLCSCLAAELPAFGDDHEKITFKRLLLNKCQEEFERGDREEEEANRTEGEGELKQTDEERVMARRRMLGSIRLLGELYKKRMLTERIMHECMRKLLGLKQKNPNPDEEDIEALCELMSTIGEMIDHPKSKECMDSYFDVMSPLSNNMTLSSRVRFMLKDTIDLRKNKWRQRRKVPTPPQNDSSHMNLSADRLHDLRIQAIKEFCSHSVLQSTSPQLERINSDSDSATGYQKGFMPSPHTPNPILHRAEMKYEVGKVTDEEQAKQRRLRSILNKLTPQNFEKLFDQVKQVNIDNADTLAGVVGQIFDNALMEPTFVEMYACFCSWFAFELPAFGDDHVRITFKRLLLNKCQEEFERGDREEEEANRTEGECELKQTDEEREEERVRARRRMLGNVRLLGELYKKRILTERIMHKCIKKLLGSNQKNLNPDDENIEALCKLMSTIGEMIDHPKAKEYMDVYFNMMFQSSNSMALSSRVRFMLKDIIDLRNNKWQKRRKVLRDAAQKRLAQSSRLPMDFRLYGSQDSRFDPFENRTLYVPLRTMGDEAITFGTRGGLVRGMPVRAQAGPSNSYGGPSRDNLASNNRTEND